MGSIERHQRFVHSYIPYDDLDPNALDSGYIRFNGEAFGLLWKECQKQGLQVVADVHTHPKRAFFSQADRENPAIPQQGHLAIVIPNFAQDGFSNVKSAHYGFFEYSGQSTWVDHSNNKSFLDIGKWYL